MSDERLLIDGAYLLSALLFIAGLKGLAKVRAAARGSLLIGAAMLLALLTTLYELRGVDVGLLAIGVGAGALLGALLGFGSKATALRGVGLLTGSGGAAASLIALSAAGGRVSGYLAAPALALALIAGMVALGGGLVIFVKAGSGASGVQLPSRAGLWSLLLVVGVLLIGALTFFTDSPSTLRALSFGAAAFGLLVSLLLAAPASARELPAAVALLNVCSGLAAAALGLAFANNALVIFGGIVFSASLTLAQVLGEGMGRSLVGLLTGGAPQVALDSGGAGYSNVRSCGLQEAALVLEDAHSVVIVPGFGYAVAQAQHATRELAQLLEKRGAKVRYAVHPMAGRMPGHMNVLLSEADVPYAQLYELEQINDDFKDTDVVVVVGGNDIVNPAAENAAEKAIYGLPVLKVGDARSVFVIKRSLRPGYTGARNPLFEADNTMLLFGDAKKVLQSLASELKGGSMGHAH